jgi:GDP-D-mannose dehydratase
MHRRRQREFVAVAFHHVVSTLNGMWSSARNSCAPGEVNYLVCDATKAHERLGWQAAGSRSSSRRDDGRWDVERLTAAVGPRELA